MNRSLRFLMLARGLMAIGLCGGLAWGGWVQAATYVANPGRRRQVTRGRGRPAQPFKTLEHAIQAAQAGDTVVAMPGSYGRITISKQGTKERPIIIKGSGRPSRHT